jgi:hypothetical protein
VTRRSTTRSLLAAGASMLALAAMTTSARASIGISAFSVTPSSTQTGGVSGNPGPSLTIDAQFTTPNGDSPKDVKLSLPPGVLANPTAVPLCSTAMFTRGACPSSSQIGSGSITGTAPSFGLTLSLPTYAYLTQPTGPEPARIGLIVYFFGFPVETQSAPIAIRTSPTVGIDIPLSSLPNQLDGIPVVINGMHLTIAGAVNGKTFTRNPTSCSTATTTATVDSYAAPTTALTKQSSFTPTGCGTLPYSPKLSGTASQDTGDDGAAFAATITQSYSEADNTKALLTLPASLSPRLSLLLSACTNVNVSQCPTIGTATVATPLLAAALTAKIVLVAHAGSVPTLAILVPAPLNLQLNATPIITGPAVQTLVIGIPDIPLSSLKLSLPGGPNSLFRAGVNLCSSPQTVSGSFTSWSGASANPAAAVPVSGCAGGTPTTGASRTPVGAVAPTAPLRSRVRVARGRTGVAAAGPRTITVVRRAGAATRLTAIRSSGGRGRSVSAVSIRLPAGFSPASGKLVRTIKAVVDGAVVSATPSIHNGVLTVLLGHSGRVAIVTVSGWPRSRSALGGRR